MSENMNRGKNHHRSPHNKKRMDNDAEQIINETVEDENAKRKKGASGSRRNENFAKSGKQLRTNGKDFKKVKVEETIEDIAKDIARIEKEIDLEIKEIMALKLGL